MTEAKALTDLAQRVTNIVSTKNYNDAQAVLKWIQDGSFDKIKAGLIETLSKVELPSSESVTLEIATPTGQVVNIDVRPDTYTTQLVAALALQLGLPEEHLRLYYGDGYVYSDEANKPSWQWQQGMKLTLRLLEWSVGYRALASAWGLQREWNAEDYDALTDMVEQAGYSAYDTKQNKSGQVLINYLTPVAEVRQAIAKALDVTPAQLQLYDDKAVLLTDEESAFAHIGLTRGSDNFWYVVTN
ncbi:Hypothetical protein POVN_LOCUS683 [uncultured virus]|nr:Hypothetical protein POVN_LOCUS683 [uncultured virus]